MGVVVPFDRRVPAQDAADPPEVDAAIDLIPDRVRRGRLAARVAAFVVRGLRWTVFLGACLARGPVHVVAWLTRFPLLIATVVAFIAAPTHPAAWALLVFSAAAFAGPALFDVAIVSLKPGPGPEPMGHEPTVCDAAGQAAVAIKASGDAVAQAPASGGDG
jgi:hypothetical protein